MAGLTALKEIRLERNWTQKALAKKLGVDAVSVSRWELGDREPRKRLREKIEKVTGIPFHKLLADSVAAEGKQ